MLTPEQQRWMEIGQAVERACTELPEGFDLHIELERDAGVVRLYLPDTDADISDFDDDTFAGKINSAIEHAKENDDTCPICEGQGEVQGYASAPTINPPIIKCCECGGTGKI